MAESPAYRLPRNVVPQHYDLTLVPELSSATYKGEEKIRLSVTEATSEIVLNAIDLEIHSAELVDEAGLRVSGTITLDDAEQQARISLSAPVQPGEWVLDLTFSGVINDKLRGFYRSTFTDDDGVEHVIATTQFEATDARRAFPCWDEPDLKATFSITLIVDEDLTALSNFSEIESKPTGDGKKQVRFAETMRMSTYLVAFVVGPLAVTDAVDVDGVPLRVACLPGKEDLAQFSLQAGAHSLRFFTNWFGLPYPGDKLDLVALPDFAFGAMENVGCVTFRENLLIIDPDSASRVELERVADVVAHEIAHMWFGDLVTMKWWNGLWLNEAFATFMELLCVDSFRPEWQRWVSFSGGRGAAMLTDGLSATRPIEFPVGRPEEAEGMFDVLTYQKGAAVLRMLERFLGAERFQAGISHYLKKHSFDNAETTDLWDAIEEATGEPVRSTMDSWIFQGGYPVVTAELDGDRLTLTQKRFRYTGASEERWSIPIMVRTVAAGSNDDLRVLLTDETTTVTLDSVPDFVVINDGGWGFFRVAYSSDLLAQLMPHLDQLNAIERFNLTSDTWAAALAGQVPVADFVALAKLLGREDDPNVWGALLGPLGTLHRMATDEDRPAIEGFIRDLARPALDRIGWTKTDNEPERTGTLRATLFSALGQIGADPDVRTKAAQLHDLAMEGGEVDPNLAGAVTSVTADQGGEGEYTAFLERWRHPRNPQEEIRYLYGLAGFQNEGLVRRALDLSLSEVRIQNAPFLLGALFSNRTGGETAWAFVKENWDTILAKMSDNLIPRMLDGLSNLSTPEVAADIRSFLASHPTKSGHKLIEQMLERLDVNVAFRQREATQLGRLFGGRA